MPLADGLSNIVNLPDGTTHVFPSDATADEMQAALSLGLPKAKPGPDKYNFDPALSAAIDFVRPFIAGAGGTAAGAGAGLLTANPIVGFGAEVGGYAAIDRMLNALKPIQQTPAGQQNEGITDSLKDGFINAIGGRIIGGLWRGGKAIANASTPEIYKFAPTTSQALEAYGHHMLATSAKFAEDFGATGAKAAALDKAGGAGFTQALGMANAMNGRPFTVNTDPVKLADKLRTTLEGGLSTNPATSFRPASHYASEEALDILSGGQNPFQKLDDVIQDPDRLSKVLKAGQLMGPSGLNVRKDLQAYQFMRIVNTAATRDASGAVTRLDPNKLTRMWTDPEMNTSLNTLFGKSGMQDVQDFIKNIAYTQDKQQTYPVAKQLRFLGSGFSLGLGLLSNNLHMAATSATSIAGLYLPVAAMGRLLTNPATSKIVTKIAGSQPLDASSGYIAKALTSALQGINIAAIDTKGNKQWGTLEKTEGGSGDYSFVPNK